MKRFVVSMLCVATTAATAQVTRVDRPYQAASAASSVVVSLPVKPRGAGALEGRTIKTLPSPAAPQNPAAQLPAQSAALPPRQSPVTQPAPSAGPGVVPSPGPVASPFEFRVSAEDIVVRRALTRWAAAAGWTFNDSLWAVSRDYPILAAASFGGDFKGAVRSLLEATKLSDSGAVKPCFYTNAVLRVVPVTERCDRSTD